HPSTRHDSPRLHDNALRATATRHSSTLHHSPPHQAKTHAYITGLDCTAEHSKNNARLHVNSQHDDPRLHGTSFHTKSQLAFTSPQITSARPHPHHGGP